MTVDGFGHILSRVQGMDNFGRKVEGVLQVYIYTWDWHAISRTFLQKRVCNNHCPARSHDIKNPHQSDSISVDQAVFMCFT